MSNCHTCMDRIVLPCRYSHMGFPLWPSPGHATRRQHVLATTHGSLESDEWPDTYADAGQYLLPMLADRRSRTVQIARAGPYDADVIVVLDDTTRPTRLHRRGRWTLADESKLSGTVPQLSHGIHLKF